MEENLKKLLLKDLCSRLPYKVKCKYSGEIPMIGEVTNNIGVLSNIHVDKDCPFEINGGIYGFADVKPYLRPMSSMTEEEKVQLSQYACIGEDLNGEFIDEIQRKDCAAYIDWLNVHYFDYRGLIEKGLAIETPENMYNVNEK